jgi:hypothetical protein
MDLGEIGLGVWIRIDWLRTGTGGGLLRVRWWTFGFLRHGVTYVTVTILWQFLEGNGVVPWCECARWVVLNFYGIVTPWSSQ